MRGCKGRNITMLLDGPSVCGVVRSLGKRTWVLHHLPESRWSVFTRHDGCLETRPAASDDAQIAAQSMSVFRASEIMLIGE